MARFPETMRSTHTDDGAVILDVGLGRIFSLNQTGSRILQLLESGCEQNAIIQHMVHEFGAEEQNAENDVREFFGLLQRNQLLLP